MPGEQSNSANIQEIGGTQTMQEYRGFDEELHGHMMRAESMFGENIRKELFGRTIEEAVAPHN